MSKFDYLKFKTVFESEKKVYKTHKFKTILLYLRIKRSIYYQRFISFIAFMRKNTHNIFLGASDLRSGTIPVFIFRYPFLGRRTDNFDV